MIMIMMMKNYVADSIISDIITMTKNSIVDTMISGRREEELLQRYNSLRKPLFRDIPPSPPFLLRKPDIEKDNDDNFFTTINSHC